MHGQKQQLTTRCSCFYYYPNIASRYILKNRKDECTVNAYNNNIPKKMEREREPEKDFFIRLRKCC